MLVVLAALLAAFAFVVLVRLLWTSARPGRYSTLITLAAVALVLGLAVLAATGRMHWLVAAAAAVAPFLRRGVRLLAYLPWIRSLMAARERAGATGGGDGRRHNGTMTRAQALEILGLGGEASREEIQAAHRRLIQKLHPDRGGSKYLAQQLNEAKARLLDEV